MRFFLGFAFALAFFVQSGEAKPLQRLYHLNSSKHIRFIPETLKSRRFVVSTPDGHRFVARKAKSLGKLNRVATGKNVSFVRAYSGNLRRGGFDSARQFVLSVIGEGKSAAVQGIFRDKSLVNTIRVHPGKRSDLEVVDSGTMPSCAGAAHADLPAQRDAAASSSQVQRALAADGNVTVDVAILFSAQAAASAGGATGVALEAAEAIAVANQAYTSSEISMQLNLVYAGSVSTSESGDFGTDLNRLATASDGFFDQAQSIRTTYGADLVSLFVNSQTFCGLAYLMTTPSSSFADAGFSVVSRVCASANFSFAHELGHNMGAQHNASDSEGSPGAYEYSYGYRFDGTNAVAYRSIMAYQSNRLETRVGYFSNPEVSYQGAATGASDANNALTLNNTASIVAAFESTVTNPPPAQSSVPKLKGVTKKVAARKCTISGKVVDSVSAGLLSGQLVSLKKSGIIKKNTLTGATGKFKFSGSRRTTYTVITGSSTKKVKCT